MRCSTLASKGLRAVLLGDPSGPALLEILDLVVVKVAAVPPFVGGPGTLQPARVMLSGGDALAVASGVETKGVVIPERLYVGPRLLGPRSEGVGVFWEQSEDFPLFLVAENIPCPGIEEDSLVVRVSQQRKPGRRSIVLVSSP